MKVTLITEAPTPEPADVLAAIGAQLGRSVRVCLDAGTITRDQAQDVLRRLERSAELG